MTRDDILIVEENVHLKHFIFELVRCIDEGVPIANFFACSDRQGCADTTLLDAQQYIAKTLEKKPFYGGAPECKFNIGDKIVPKSNQTDVFFVTDFLDVCINIDTFAKGVAVKRVSDDSPSRIYPVSYINNYFLLVE